MAEVFNSKIEAAAASTFKGAIVMPVEIIGFEIAEVIGAIVEIVEVEEKELVVKVETEVEIEVLEIVEIGIDFGIGTDGNKLDIPHFSRIAWSCSIAVAKEGFCRCWYCESEIGFLPPILGCPTGVLDF